MISKSKHSVIKYAKIFLQLRTDESISDEHVSEMKLILQGLIDSGLSPREIKERYSIKHSNFAAFLRHFGISLKSRTESVVNYRKRSGTALTNEKEKFYAACDFKFNPYDESLLGYDLLVNHGMYHPITNKEGVCRDHILSKSDAFKLRLDPSIISHKANCQFLTNRDNVLKGETSWITYEELQTAILNGSIIGVTKFIKGKAKPKSQEHRRKLSDLNKQFMMITDGKENLRVLKSCKIPAGFRKGFVRKKVPAVGLEPTSCNSDEA